MVFHEGLIQGYDEDSDKGYLKRKEKLRQTHTSSEADTRSQGNQVQSRYMDKSSHWYERETPHKSQEWFSERLLTADEQLGAEKDYRESKEAQWYQFLQTDKKENLMTDPHCYATKWVSERQRHYKWIGQKLKWISLCI